MQFEKSQNLVNGEKGDIESTSFNHTKHGFSICRDNLQALVFVFLGILV